MKPNRFKPVFIEMKLETGSNRFVFYSNCNRTKPTEFEYWEYAVQLGVWKPTPRTDGSTQLAAALLRHTSKIVFMC